MADNKIAYAGAAVLLLLLIIGAFFLMGGGSRKAHVTTTVVTSAVGTAYAGHGHLNQSEASTLSNLSNVSQQQDVNYTSNQNISSAP